MIPYRDEAPPEPGTRWRPEIDLHCHILPQWDDGPTSVEESLAMAQRAVASGLTHVVATPHVGRAFNGRELAASTIQLGVEALQREIDAQSIPLQIVSGAEVMIGQVDIRERMPNEPELTYGGSAHFALIEPPTLLWPAYGAQAVSTLGMQGVQPVIAHPERYGNVQKDIMILQPLMHQGALFQITAAALAGSMGKTLRNCCLQLLRVGMVSFVASDAHRAEGTLPGDVQDELIGIVGEEAAWTILFLNPRRLLEGKRVRPPEVNDSIAPPGLMGRLFNWGR